ncbi:MAG TPA: universal stress protein [Candidatus Dormibacteraeota bacterium]
MIGRLLLAIDRSGHAEEAVRATAELAADLSAEVRVLHVHETPIAASMYAAGELEAAHVETLEAAEALVERTVTRLRDAGLTASGRVTLAGGTTAGEIVAAAREWDADLIAIGALGASRWHELLVGGVAHAVAQLATCPVLVVPRRAAPGSLRRMVLGADGSSGAARAAALTAELSACLHAAVLVVHVAEEIPAEHDPEAIARAAAEAVGADRVTCARVRIAGPGGAAGGLRAEALDFGAGLLVVGRRGRSPLLRLLLGGVSERLLHITPCPLLVVPEADPAVQ